MPTNKPTKKEHYIPQFYLKGFSPNNKQVFQYDILNRKSYPMIDTKRICYQKNLYELKDSNDSIVETNIIESALSKYEGAFQELFMGIDRKAKNNQNFNTRSFLSTQEKALLIGFLSLQIMRMPYWISIGEQNAIDIFDLKPYQARNFSILTNLPIYKQLDASSSNIFSLVANWFTDMSFMIFKSRTNNIFTSDNPIYIFSKDKNSNDINIKPEKVIFPLTSNLVLYMLPVNTYPEYKNRLIPIIDYILKEVHQSIALTSNRFIYSYRPLMKDEIRTVEEARS